MVAAWINALTGVGPSIASGSHTYSGICADLPVAPTKSNNAIVVSTGAPAASACALSAPSSAWRIPELAATIRFTSAGLTDTAANSGILQALDGALSAHALAAGGPVLPAIGLLRLVGAAGRPRH